MTKNKYLLVALLLAGATMTACTKPKDSAKESATDTSTTTDTVTDSTSGSELPELPAPFDEDATGDFSVTNSNITASNFDDYANRPDVRYVDLRETGPYTISHLQGFEVVPFFSTIYGTDQAGKQLFGTDYLPRYEESVELLEEIFPKEETLFLMCQSGGRVAVCMQIMQKYGWDMSRIYNIGGMNQYGSSQYKVDNIDVSSETADNNFTVATTEDTGTAVTTYTKLIEDLPYPAKDDNARSDYSVANSSITAANFDEYANRSDVLYVDLRNAGDYTKSYLKGFEMIEFFATIFASTSEKQLFYKNADGKFVARYEESVETLETLLPKDKTIFLMCQSGGRVVSCMQIMAQFGWDMGRVYNIGGMAQYSDSQYRVDNVIAGELADGDVTPITSTVLTGTYKETSFGHEYTTNVTVFVKDNKIAAVYAYGECSDSSTWPANATWTSAKDAFLQKIVGKTQAEVTACISDGSLTPGSDAVTGATLSTTRVYKAVINAFAQ